MSRTGVEIIGIVSNPSHKIFFMDKNRFDILNSTLDSSLRMKLEQIRRFLSQGKASVMVGAGFSKNAEMSEGVKMKDWGELCEEFHKELYGVKPGDHDFKLKSALRLAQQLESAKGRNALDELIKSSLPNDSVAPGYLHKLLVKLPWRDVFTTNYDTLLEDAAILSFKRYNVVTSKDSLIYQPHPRIVKVHGSFPDNRPFIITEEDYRTYPTVFPEFVNTVRQALIETQFCLLGFSGDDPNFLNWLGWFRDIMGKQMLPVYMVYIGKNPHHSETMLLKERGIELLVTGEISDDPAEGIDFILSYIGSIHEEKEEWSAKMGKYAFDSTEFMRKSIPKMKEIRESYPGWIILPSDKITEFHDTCDRFPFFSKYFSELSLDHKVDFLYEYIWRLNISFMPYWFEDGWFHEALHEIKIKLDEINPDMRWMTNEILLALLHIYRIKDSTEFKHLLEEIKSRESSNQSSILRKLRYEESLWLLQHAEHEKLKECLDNWKVTPDDYISALWKSKVLIETGNPDEAEKLLEKAIDSVRRKLLVNSQSNYHTSALAVLSNCLRCLPYQRKDQLNEDKSFLFIEYIKIAEREFENAHLQGKTRTHIFGIGSHNNSWDFGNSGYVTTYVGAARYFQIAETYGYPIGSDFSSYNEKYIEAMLPRVAQIDFRTAIMYLYEGDSKKAFESTFDRAGINYIGKDTAIRVYDYWLEILKNFDILNCDKTSKDRILTIIIPMLARLSVWQDIPKILDFITILLKLRGETSFDLDKSLNTAYSSLDEYAASELWWEIMDIPIQLSFMRCDVPLPDAYIHEWKGDDKTTGNVIDGLYAEDSDVRRAAKHRLERLYYIAPEEVKSRFDDAIKDRFEILRSPSFISYLGVWNTEHQCWSDLYRIYLKSKFSDFITSNVEFKGSSVEIDHISDNLHMIVNCIDDLNDDEKISILRKIETFLVINKKSLAEDDSASILGGFRKFFSHAMYYVNYFVSHCNHDKIPEDLRTSLLPKLIDLRNDYNVSSSIIKLSFHRKSDKVWECSSKEKKVINDILRHWLLSNCSSSDMQEAFTSLVLFHSLSKYGVQNIIGDVIERMKFILDETSIHYLKYLRIWINNDIIRDSNFKKLITVLNALADDVASSNLDADLKTDVLFYGGKLIGYMSEIVPNNEDITNCLIKWNVLFSGDNISNDIKRGLEIGKLLGGQKEE